MSLLLPGVPVRIEDYYVTEAQADIPAHYAQGLLLPGNPKCLITSGAMDISPDVLTATLPLDVGQLLYTSSTVAGILTTVPSGQCVAIATGQSSATGYPTILVHMPGFVGAGGGTGTGISKTNSTGATIYAGQPVKLSGASACALAQANSAAGMALGVAAADTPNGANVLIIRQGLITKADWTNVTGGGLLTVDSKYYLVQGTAGRLSTTKPTGSGDLEQMIGWAVTSGTLYVDVMSPILM